MDLKFQDNLKAGTQTTGTDQIISFLTIVFSERTNQHLGTNPNEALSTMETEGILIFLNL